MRGACAMLCAACVLVMCVHVQARERGAGSSDADLAAAERHLLALMGLERRPERRPRDRDSRPPVPRAMRILYEHSEALPRGPSNTVRSFEHTPTVIDERFPREHRFRLFFNVSGVPADEAARGADLLLQRSEFGATHGAGAQRLLVYDVVRPGSRSRRDGPVLRLLDSVEMRPGDTAVTADALAAVRRWASEPKHNHGLLVRVLEESGGNAEVTHVRVRRLAADSDEEWRAARPLLLLYTEDSRARTARETRTRRSKRAAPASPRRRQHRAHHRRKDVRETCQKRQLYVDFADVGWSDWIVAPQGYDAYYCAGDCPFPLADHLNGTNHAIVQTLVNSVNPGAVPKACCVPTQLASISMLYMDEMNNVVLKNYQDMAVVGCGCR